MTKPLLSGARSSGTDRTVMDMRDRIKNATEICAVMALGPRDLSSWDKGGK